MTLPVNELLRIANVGQFTSLELATKYWMAFPEENCRFYRVTVFSNYSPHNFPNFSQSWSLMGRREVFELPYKPVDLSNLFKHMIQRLINARQINNRGQIVFRCKFHAKYGCWTSGLHRDEALSRIVPWLELYDVILYGCFGRRRCEMRNQDYSFV